MADILVLNGPNLNLLGLREPGIYGAATLSDVCATLSSLAASDGLTADFLQSNAEYALLDRIHATTSSGERFAIINPGAFTHTSVALRDAFLGVSLPFIEVHISNVHKREGFRAHSYLSDVAEGVIVGLGVQGYELAYAAAARRLLTNADS